MTMNQSDKRLLNELLTVIVVKIGLLALLWLFFIHGARLSVDGRVMADHAMPENGVSIRGGSNAR